MLVLKPLIGLAILELSGSTDNNTLEFLEFLKDLLFDLVVVVISLVSVKLLGEIRDGSPELILVKLEVVLNDLTSFSGGVLDGVHVTLGFHLNTVADELDAFSKGLGSHGEGTFGSSSSDVDFLLLIFLQAVDVLVNLSREGIECSGHLNDHQSKFLVELFECAEVMSSLVYLEAWWAVLVGVLFFANSFHGFPKLVDMVIHPCVDLHHGLVHESCFVVLLEALQGSCIGFELLPPLCYRARRVVSWIKEVILTRARIKFDIIIESINDVLHLLLELSNNGCISIVIKVVLQFC